jgi:glycosyltransferase involved in cell wall biosynthesis
VREFAFVLPGDPATLTGGYLYARRVLDLLPSFGWRPRVVSLPARFPFPDDADLAETAGVLGALERGDIAVIDGLAFGAIPLALLRACPATLVALVHHPLADESGLAPVTAEALLRSERDALTTAARVIVTSPHTARDVAARFGVAAPRIAVAPPGTDPAPRARGSGAEPCLLTVATATPRKGHDVLVAALSEISDLPWRAIWAGSLERDPVTATALRRRIDAAGLAGRIALRGDVPPAGLGALYDRADAFVLPSRHEGYGMAFAEALARGLPVVGCGVGAVPETVPADAGLLVPADAPAALAAALRRLLTTPEVRRRMADAAFAAGRRLPRWHDTARAIAAVLTEAAQHAV